jgi:hypothetical protein
VIDWQQVFRPNWTAFEPLVALFGLPALVAVLLVGGASHQVTPALVASTGALVTGFGAMQIAFRNPLIPMLAVAAGASLSAGIGTLANAWLPVEALCTFLWGTGLGVANLIAPAPGWLSLQGAIALVIAASFPATPPAAAERFGLVLGGAVLQMVAMAVLIGLAPGPFRRLRAEAPASVTLGTVLRRGLAIIDGREPGLGLAVTMGVAVTAADLLAHGLPNGYWVPMTVLLVMRPDVRETTSRAVMRLGGTLIGAGVLTLAMAWVRPSPLALVALAGVAGWSCFALMRVNYALLSVGITSYVVALFALAGLPEPLVALHRSVATAAGGVIALGTHWLYCWIVTRGGRRLVPGAD